MLFKYSAINKEGKEVSGTIEAVNEPVAIRSLQQRDMVISSIRSTSDVPFYQRSFGFLEKVSNKEIVIFSRQIATLFEAQVSALRVFQLIGNESENPLLQRTLSEVASDLQGGSSIAKALEKHPRVFSSFYANMVRAGEESGKLSEVFLFLADYLDRTYEVTTKARSALVYPSFVIATFIGVMILMLTTVIPKLSSILEDSGQITPLYTRVVIAISDFIVNYGIFFLVALVVGGFFLWQYIKRSSGKSAFARFKISLPYVGTLYKKLYLSRIADNMSTMLDSGIPMVRAIEITSNVVDNKVYEEILTNALNQIKSGGNVADSLSGNDEIPNIMIAMIRVGEESGELGNILRTLAKFYRREVTNAVDTLVDLIEPAMIVLLGLGVGILLASVLIPIYNISASF
jgi:type IV pilus assembly protein PilC